MARTQKSNDQQRSMLSLWEPPEHAGDPIGVVATTYTLNTALFEEECLARFAGVQSDPLRDGALYCIEREEKLASLKCAAVIADIHHCAGRRSLRWDLLAARPDSGVMHAKISLLAWRNHIRVIIASANLTAEGYRRNQECATVLDFADGAAEEELLDPLLAFLSEVLDTTSGPASARARDLLAWLDSSQARISANTRGLQRRLVLTGPGREDVFTQLNAWLPPSRPERVHVVSPFFDDGLRKDGPDSRVWQLLRQRGNAELHLHVAGEFAPETGHWRLQVPCHVRDAVPSGRDGVALYLRPIRTDSVRTDHGNEHRPLHAKMLTLCHQKWIAWMVGSSNFTSAGMGLNRGARNFEANVVYYLRADTTDTLYRQMETGGLCGADPLSLTQDIEWAQVFGDDGEGNVEPPLPRFFALAELLDNTDDGHRLSLTFDALPPPGSWRVHNDNRLLIDHASWLAKGEPQILELLTSRIGPPPSTLTVEWQGVKEKPHSAAWPVNARTANALPPPDELRNLSLVALLELLSSSRPMHETMRGWLRRQTDDDDPDGMTSVELIDPHQKVDTSGFLIKRVQRACGALAKLRERLEQPVLSEAALAWRLDGPVGVRAVAAAMRKQCDSSLPDEWAFLLCELVREVKSVRLVDLKGLPVQSPLQQQMDQLIADLQGEMEDVLASATESMKVYASASQGDDRHAHT